MGKIILIGGAPAVGKSYLARQLSSKLGIPWITTEDIHALMGQPKEHKEQPKIFDSEGQPPQTFFRTESPEETLSHYITLEEDVWKDVLLFIKKNDLWTEYIIEGSAVMPQLVARDLKDRHDIFPLFLCAKSEDRIRNIIRMQAVWDHTDEYAQRAKKLSIDWVLLFNRWIQTNTKKYNLPLLELSEESISIEEVIKKIK